MDAMDVAARFAFHEADTEEKRDLHRHVRLTMATAAGIIRETVPEGREQALALTKLEEAMFWANAGVARGLS